MFTLNFAGLRADNSKSVIIESWNIVWGERTKVPTFEQRDTIDNLLQSKIFPFLHIFSNNTKFVNYNRRHSFTQYNDFSKFFKRMGKTYFQSLWFSNKFRI